MRATARSASAPSAHGVWRGAGIIAALLLVGAPAAAPGQVFLATDPHPPFSIGPFFVVANVTPDLRSVAVRLSFSLTFPPPSRAEDMHQDLYLLWPAELAEATAPGPAEPGLRRFVEARGFEVDPPEPRPIGNSERAPVSVQLVRYVRDLLDKSF